MKDIKHVCAPMYSYLQVAYCTVKSTLFSAKHSRVILAYNSYVYGKDKSDETTGWQELKSTFTETVTLYDEWEEYIKKLTDLYKPQYHYDVLDNAFKDNIL